MIHDFSLFPNTTLTMSLNKIIKISFFFNYLRYGHFHIDTLNSLGHLYNMIIISNSNACGSDGSGNSDIT
jgi:hypothetical protein